MKKLFLAILLIGIYMPDISMAINQDQLWLPRGYYKHFRALHKAAEISEKTERCKYVIAGTLSQERSNKAHPVFIITCRDEERQTFAYIVDGLSLEILNRPAPPDPEQLAQQQLQQEIEKKWAACDEQIKRRTKGLRGVAWLGEEIPEAKLEGKIILGFVKDFNAASPSGRRLYFRADCVYENDKKIIAINVRPKEKDGEMTEASVEP